MKKVSNLITLIKRLLESADWTLKPDLLFEWVSFQHNWLLIVKEPRKYTVSKE